MIPPSEKKNLKKDILYLSRKETIQELKEKLYRIFSEKFESNEKLKDSKNCKIWKLNDKYTISMIQEFVEKNFQVQLMNCKKLEDKMSLEVF